jgi:type IV secretory pathway VirB2 component (pilin)
MSESNRTLRLDVSIHKTLVHSLLSVAALIGLVSPAAAAHNGTMSSTECSAPESLTPLMELLHSLGELAFLGGVSIGTLGFLFAGICLMLPGEDWNRRGRSVAKNVFIGVILLMSANMIVAYLISQMGGTFC